MVKIGIAGSTIDESDPIYEKLERLGETIRSVATPL
jgi:hypothetical protein